MAILKIIFISTFLFSCSHLKRDEYPLEGKEYRDDQVSVQSAVNLAYSAYLKACVDSGGIFRKCSDLAKKYIESDVIGVLDQDGKGDGGE